MTSYQDDDIDDDRWDDDADEGDDSDDEPTVPCPYCGWQMLEDSPRCPSCVIATALVCLAIAFWWLFAAV